MVLGMLDTSRTSYDEVIRNDSARTIIRPQRSSGSEYYPGQRHYLASLASRQGGHRCLPVLVFSKCRLLRATVTICHSGSGGSFDGLDNSDTCHRVGNSRIGWRSCLAPATLRSAHRLDTDCSSMARVFDRLRHHRCDLRKEAIGHRVCKSGSPCLPL